MDSSVLYGGGVNLPRITGDANQSEIANVTFKEYTNSSTNIPDKHYYHIATFHSPDPAHKTQIALSMTSEGAYYRVCNANNWSNWRSILNTWRGIQNNLTSDSTTDSLSAAQGKALKGLVDKKKTVYPFTSMADIGFENDNISVIDFFKKLYEVGYTNTCEIPFTRSGPKKRSITDGTNTVSINGGMLLLSLSSNLNTAWSQATAIYNTTSEYNDAGLYMISCIIGSSVSDVTQKIVKLSENAVKDGNGNNIVDTYATKNDLALLQEIGSTVLDTGNVTPAICGAAPAYTVLYNNATGISTGTTGYSEEIPISNASSYNYFKVIGIMNANTHIIEVPYPLSGSYSNGTSISTYPRPGQNGQNTAEVINTLFYFNNNAVRMMVSIAGQVGSNGTSSARTTGSSPFLIRQIIGCRF